MYYNMPEYGHNRENGGFMRETGKSLTIPQLSAVMAGNALEFYDFLVFLFFAVPIAATFFPSESPTSSLLRALAVSGVGFLARPLGGLLIGPLGDRIGRKPAMLFSFGLMGFAIVGMALTPSYASIGIAAPILVVIFRLLQGFALGGEVGPTTAFLMEAAPPEKRGLYVSMQLATQYAATLTAGVIGVLLAQLLTPENLVSWGWRVAMLLGAAVVPLALIIRRRLPETFERPAGVKPPAMTRAQLGLSLLMLAMAAAATITTYTLITLNIFATTTLGLTPTQAFGAVVIGGICGAIGCPIGGWLCDRLGRKPVMITTFALLCAVSVPCFMLMAQLRTTSVLYASAALMVSLLALGTPATLAFLSENLPAHLRSGGIGIIYAVAIALFGGTAPFVVTWLTDVTKSPIAPAWYMCAALLVALCAMLAVRESAPVKTGSR